MIRPKYRRVRSTKAKLLEIFTERGVEVIAYPTTGQVSVAKAHPDIFTLTKDGRRYKITLKAT